MLRSKSFAKQVLGPLFSFLSWGDCNKLSKLQKSRNSQTPEEQLPTLHRTNAHHQKHLPWWAKKTKIQYCMDLTPLFVHLLYVF